MIGVGMMVGVVGVMVLGMMIVARKEAKAHNTGHIYTLWDPERRLLRAPIFCCRVQPRCKTKPCKIRKSHYESASDQQSATLADKQSLPYVLLCSNRLLPTVCR